jgi:hypothetical protein
LKVTLHFLPSSLVKATLIILHSSSNHCRKIYLVLECIMRYR